MKAPPSGSTVDLEGWVTILSQSDKNAFIGHLLYTRRYAKHDGCKGFTTFLLCCRSYSNCFNTLLTLIL